MLAKIFAAISTTILFALSPLPAHAQDANALLDLLVKKKILTEKEAQSVRADLSKGSPPVTASVNSGDKWKLSTPITEIELYGDARVRYEYRGGQSADSGPLMTIGRSASANVIVCGSDCISSCRRLVRRYSPRDEPESALYKCHFRR